MKKRWVQLVTVCHYPSPQCTQEEEEEAKEERRRGRIGKDWGMENQGQDNKSRVVKVDSKASWDSYLSQATNQGSPIVAHFTASWCIPSVAMKPVLEELASIYQDVLFLTIDVDEVKEVAVQYEVKAMPTFLLMKEGVQFDKLVGANPDEIRKRVEGLVQPPQVNVA